MNGRLIRVDRCALKSRRIYVYRVSQQDSATLYWMSPRQAVRYLRSIRAKKLPAKTKGR